MRLSSRWSRAGWALAALAAAGLVVSGPLKGGWAWALAVAVGAGLWIRSRRSDAAALPPRLRVEARVALNSRTEVALLTVDGSRFILVHGDRFAQLQEILEPEGLRPAPALPLPERAVSSWSSGWFQ